MRPVNGGILLLFISVKSFIAGRLKRAGLNFYLFRNNGLNQKAILSVHFQRVAGSLSPAAAFGSNLCG